MSQLVNHFCICLDASGSMRGIAEQAIRVFNQQVETIRKGVQSSNQKSDVTLITFGEGDGEIRTKFIGVDPDYFRPIDRYSYQPSGGTPLLAAVERAISTLSALENGNPNHSCLVVVITDGEENQSARYGVTWDQVRSQLKSKIATDRWTFAFSGPAGSRRYFEELGAQPGNIQEWEATEAGATALTKSLSIGTQSYYGARSAGLRSTNNFFTTDASKVSQTDLHSLPTVRMKSWQIEHECPIQSFVESKGLTYAPGNGYYQLTKPEKVQAYKALLIREKGKKTVYGGDVRNLLGLPNYEVKVTPGNHANYDIFVQSASNNRKLVRGTTLLYREP